MPEQDGAVVSRPLGQPVHWGCELGGVHQGLGSALELINMIQFTPL